MFSKFNEILNLEGIVRPRMEAATLDIAIVVAMDPALLTIASSASYMKVFHVPPGPAMKKAPGLQVFTLSMIASYVFLCPPLNANILLMSSSSIGMDSSSSIFFNNLPSMFASLVCYTLPHMF